jgi:hypothetical protein
MALILITVMQSSMPDLAGSPVMGSFYANVTVLDTSLDAVKEVLAGTGAHLAVVDRDVVVFSADHQEPLGGDDLAARLATALGVPVVDVAVFDSDFAVIHVLGTDGEIAAAATAPPNGAEIMSEMAGDPAMVPGAGVTTSETAAALVAAVGRGDAAKVKHALEADNVFAEESHHGVFAGLELPTVGVGWGHRTIEADRELFDSVPLVTA